LLKASKSDIDSGEAAIQSMFAFLLFIWRVSECLILSASTLRS
jgi:hypothetical protein